MKDLVQLLGFAYARAAMTANRSRPVWPAHKFRELTGSFPSQLRSPGARGHNSHVWRAVTKSGATMKLYRFDHQQSARQMITFLALLGESGIRVPQVYEFNDAQGWVVAEWIEGEPLTLDAVSNTETQKEIAAFQASINRISAPETQIRRKFSYFHHLVLERYLYWTSKRFGSFVAAVNTALTEHLARKWPAFPKGKNLVMTDPDFSVANLVRSGSGELAIIDTEFLTTDVNAAFEIANFVARTRRVNDTFYDNYLSAYNLKSQTSAYLDEKAFWDACVALKRVGKQAMNWRASETDLLRQIDSIGNAICAS